MATAYGTAKPAVCRWGKSWHHRDLSFQLCIPAVHLNQLYHISGPLGAALAHHNCIMNGLFSKPPYLSGTGEKNNNNKKICHTELGKRFLQPIRPVPTGGHTQMYRENT